MNRTYKYCQDVDRDLGWCATNGELNPDGSPGTYGHCKDNCYKSNDYIKNVQTLNWYIVAIPSPLIVLKENSTDTETAKKCCKDQNIVTCQAVTVQTELFNNKQDIDVLGSILSFDQADQMSQPPFRTLMESKDSNLLLKPS